VAVGGRAGEEEAARHDGGQCLGRQVPAVREAAPPPPRRRGRGRRLRCRGVYGGVERAAHCSIDEMI
jgi:hypothetical protein